MMFQQGVYVPVVCALSWVLSCVAYSRRRKLNYAAFPEIMDKVWLVLLAGEFSAVLVLSVLMNRGRPVLGDILLTISLGLKMVYGVSIACVVLVQRANGCEATPVHREEGG